MIRSAVVGLVLAALLLGGRAEAAPPAPPDTEAKARVHFKRAGEHFVKEEWRAALDEYREVLALTRNRAALRAAAIRHRAWHVPGTCPRQRSPAAR